MFPSFLESMALQHAKAGSCKIRKMEKVSARSAETADQSMARRQASKIGGDHGFLRVQPKGYNLGSDNDPDNLLPTFFSKKK
jgi:hypothetical protein